MRQDSEILARLRAAGPPPSFEHLHDAGLLQRLGGDAVRKDLAYSAAEYEQERIPTSGEDAEPVEHVKPTAELLTLDQAAAYLNVTADQVTAFVQDGELRFINVGRGSKRPRYRFTVQDLDEFIEQRRRREIQCRSTSQRSRHTMPSTSKSVVIGFTAQQNARRAARLKPSKP